MFRSGADGLRDVNAAPALLGADAFSVNNILIGAFDTFFVTAGMKIHFPNCTVAGGKLVFQNKAIIIWFGLALTLTNAATVNQTVILSNYNDGAIWSIGTDGNGAYLTVVSQTNIIQLGFGNPPTYASGTWNIAAVYPSNDYNNNLSRYPLAYFSSAIT